DPGGKLALELTDLRTCGQPAGAEHSRHLLEGLRHHFGLRKRDWGRGRDRRIRIDAHASSQSARPKGSRRDCADEYSITPRRRPGLIRSRCPTDANASCLSTGGQTSTTPLPFRWGLPTPLPCPLPIAKLRDSNGRIRT